MKNRTIRLGWTLLTELWQNWTRKKGFATPTICWKLSRAFGNHLDPVNDSRDGRLEGKCDSDPCFPGIRRLRKNCTFEGSDTLYKYSIFDLPPSETARRRLNKIILTPVKIKSKLMTEYNEGQAIWRVSKVTRRVLYVIGVVAAFLCFAGSSATFTAIFVVFCSHCSRPNSLLVWLNGLAAVSLAAIGITILYFVIFGCREGDNTENDADVVISEIPAEDVEKSPAPVIPYNHIPHYSPFVQPSSRDLPDYFTTIQNSNGGDLPDYYSILQKGNGAQLFADAEISGDITPPCYEKALEMTRSGTACVDVRSSNSIWPFVWGKGIIISQNGTIMTLLYYVPWHLSDSCRRRQVNNGITFTKFGCFFLRERRTSKTRARVKISPTRKKRRGGREKNDHVSRLAWGNFHARSRFARSTIPEEKWGLLVVYGPTYT